jgi:hypothetical protein
VWERLSQNEANWLGTLGDCRGDFSDMSIMLIRTLHPMKSQLEPVETRSRTSGVTENTSCFKEEGRATHQSSTTSTKTN